MIYGIFFIQRKTKCHDLTCHIDIFLDHIVLIFLNLILTPFTNLNPGEFGCNSVD